MKPYLLIILFCATYTNYSAQALSSDASDEYPNGSVTYTANQIPQVMLSEYETITFKVSKYSNYGASVHNSSYSELMDNKMIYFVNNDAYVPRDESAYNKAYGGAVYNSGTFIFKDNMNIDFSMNRSDATAKYYSYYIYTNVDAFGGAIYNSGAFSMKENAEISICGNRSNTSTNSNSHGFSYGGAIYNSGDFTLCGNGNVNIQGNSVLTSYRQYGIALGGAIYMSESAKLVIEGNDSVVFRENYELHDFGRPDADAKFNLRSVYSNGAEMKLSAGENQHIIFYDSIYVSSNKEVSYNASYIDMSGETQKGLGDIIFSGKYTREDLGKLKYNFTQKELEDSLTSEVYAIACLYGGRLIVEDGAILKGQGITITDGANATIRLNGGTLDETGYTVAVSSGSGLEFEGANTLAASSVSLADNSFLNFSLEEAQISVNWNADLDIQGSLSLNLTHADKPVHDTYALLAMQGGNTVTGWDVANLSISGASAEHLVWENNTLYYRPMLVQENGDTTLDKDVETEAAGGTIGGKDDVNIDGNGHTLTVKNAVQLVQMALKNGTVKLEGENNNVVSVTLTEDGTLVLTAGAGLKTGDIISMVANGKGELVISGDITLDEHGMKGKAGSMASVSNMNATTTGDAVFENVAFTDSLLDIGEGTTATFKNAVLGAGTRVTDAPATAKFENTLALLDSTNTAVVTESTTAAALQLYRSGDTANAVTLDAGAALVDLTCTVFDTITLSGSDLYLDLTALAVTLGDADAFSLTFSNGTLAAIDTDSLHIFATLDGEHYLAGYTTQQGGMAEKVYFTTSASVPEPATTTLSLLALAALAARRKRVA